VIAIDLRGPIKRCRAVLDSMIARGGGRIVSISSDAGRVGSRRKCFTSRRLRLVPLVPLCACPGMPQNDVIRRTGRRGISNRGRAFRDQVKAMQMSDLEHRLITILWTITFMVALAALSVGFLTHANTFALADAVIRWLAPHASAEDISTLHILGRELGHFVIPEGAYLALVL